MCTFFGTYVSYKWKRQEVCLRANGAQGTRKHNYILNHKLRVFTLSLNHIYKPRVGRLGKSQEHAWEKGGLRESGPVLTMLNHSKWLTYLGWGGMDDSAWYECTCWFAPGVKRNTISNVPQCATLKCQNVDIFSLKRGYACWWMESYWQLMGVTLRPFETSRHLG